MDCLIYIRFFKLFCFIFSSFFHLHNCCFFVFFPSVKKYETTVLGNGWTDFHETFTKRYGRKCSLHRHTKMGARPPNNFWGLKTEESDWRHLANIDDLRNLRYDSCAIIRGRHARRLRLQMHETVNGFNLVNLYSSAKRRPETCFYPVCPCVTGCILKHC